MTVQSVAPWRKTAKKARLCSGWTLHVVAGVPRPASVDRVAAHVAGVPWRCSPGPSGAAVTEGVVTVQSTSNHWCFTQGRSAVRSGKAARARWGKARKKS